MNRITLGQLVQYLDIKPDVCEMIQVVMPGHDWDDCDEISAGSELLEPFYDYCISFMGCALSFLNGDPVMRVQIEVDNISTLRKVG